MHLRITIQTTTGVDYPRILRDLATRLEKQGLPPLGRPMNLRDDYGHVIGYCIRYLEHETK